MKTRGSEVYEVPENISFCEPLVTALRGAGAPPGHRHPYKQWPDECIQPHTASIQEGVAEAPHGMCCVFRDVKGRFCLCPCVLNHRAGLYIHGLMTAQQRDPKNCMCCLLLCAALDVWCTDNSTCVPALMHDLLSALLAGTTLLSPSTPNHQSTEEATSAPEAAGQHRHSLALLHLLTTFQILHDCCHFVSHKHESPHCKQLPSPSLRPGAWGQQPSPT